MAERLKAKRYYVSGMVQGVGFRYFARRVAERLGIAGYVRNLRDGRVEIYAIGSGEQHQTLRAELERGPGAAMVSGVAEEEAAVSQEYSGKFMIEHEW